MESPSRRSLEEELAATQAEDRRLKERARLEGGVAAIRAAIQCVNESARLKGEVASIQAQLAAIQAKNPYLKELKRSDGEIAGLNSEKRRLKEVKGRLLAETLDSAKTEGLNEVVAGTEERRRFAKRRRSTSEETDTVLTEEEIRSIRCAEDVVGAAMEYVQDGKATLIVFSVDEVSASCGELNWAVQLPAAAHVGDWLAVFQAVIEASERYCACPVLYLDDARLILADSSGNEATESLMQYFEEVVEQLEKQADKPPIDFDAIRRAYESL